MKKFLIVVLSLLVLIAGAVLAIGFTANASIDQRADFVVDAPIAKVWEVVSDPKRVADWMPVRTEDERIVEVKFPGALENAARMGEQAAKTGDVDVKKLDRHTYVHKNGATTTVEVVERTANKVIKEHVVDDTTGMAKMFPEMNWGFEVADAGGGKTKLTTFMVATAAKPLGTFVCKMMEWSGANEKFQGQMAKNVETLAKGGKVQ